MRSTIHDLQTSHRKEIRRKAIKDFLYTKGKIYSPVDFNYRSVQNIVKNELKRNIHTQQHYARNKKHTFALLKNKTENGLKNKTKRNYIPVQMLSVDDLDSIGFKRKGVSEEGPIGEEPVFKRNAQAFLDDGAAQEDYQYFPGDNPNFYAAGAPPPKGL